MSRIGRLETSSNDHGETIAKGQIAVQVMTPAGLSLFKTYLRFDPVEDRRSDKSPSHEVMSMMQQGERWHASQVGSAWLRTVERGQFSGQRMFSINIDIPGLMIPLDVAAFEREGEQGQFEIAYSRRRKAASGGGSDGAPSPSGGDLDDEIPF